MLALRDGRIDAVLFTSAVQAQNIAEIAGQMGFGVEFAGWLTRCVIASVGPVCTRALLAIGVNPTFEANPPKLGPLVAGLAALFDTSSSQNQ